jgi:hypothetical protein
MLIEMTLVPAMLERDWKCEVQDLADVEAGKFATSARFVAQSRPSASRSRRTSARRTSFAQIFAARRGTHAWRALS